MNDTLHLKGNESCYFMVKIKNIVCYRKEEAARKFVLLIYSIGISTQNYIENNWELLILKIIKIKIGIQIFLLLVGGRSNLW